VLCWMQSPNGASYNVATWKYLIWYFRSGMLFSFTYSSSEFIVLQYWISVFLLWQGTSFFCPLGNNCFGQQATHRKDFFFAKNGAKLCLVWRNWFFEIARFRWSALLACWPKYCERL
jgi:hypothetical protein